MEDWALGSPWLAGLGGVAMSLGSRRSDGVMYDSLVQRDVQYSKM